MNILLCGLPFSGKSTYGALAAAQLKTSFIETDKLIETLFQKKTGRSLSCRLIHGEFGEFFFNSLEEEVATLLAKTCPFNSCHVISLGSCILLSQNNADLLSTLGSIVYLKTPIETLLQRLHQETHTPVFLSSKDPEKDFQKLAEQRSNLYESLAHNITKSVRDGWLHCWKN